MNNSSRPFAWIPLTGNNFGAPLTIDLGNDDLISPAALGLRHRPLAHDQQSGAGLRQRHGASQKTTVSTLENGWAQHVTGITGVPPLAPARLTGSLWLISGQPNCAAFSSSDQEAAASFVETIPPNGAGTTPGMLGFMFWAAGCQGQGTGCTHPPTTCEGGMGVAATTFNIPIPMPTLRSQ